MSLEISIFIAIGFCSILLTNEYLYVDALVKNYSFMFVRTDSFQNGPQDGHKNDFESQLKNTIDGNKCGNNRRIIGYVPNWSTHPLSAKQATLLTNAIYAFMEMDSNGRLKLPNGLGSRQRLKELMIARRVHIAKGLDFKVSFAIGGWEDSKYFSHVLRRPDLRNVFIAEIQKMLTQYDFDGVDIDWEYPVTGGAVQGIPEDRENYVAFLRDLRAKLGKNRLISIAAGAGQEAFTGYDVKNIIKYVDWIGVMSYDFFGAWESKWGAFVGPNAPLFHSAPPGYSGKLNVDYAMKKYSCSGKQLQKIVMGIPFYGRFWAKTIPGKYPNDYPNFRTAENSNGKYGGEVTYRQLQYSWKINSDSTYKKYWDDRSKTPWAMKDSLIVTYDNEKSIAAKVKYANSRNIGGVMIWSIDHDDDNQKLLETVSKNLCHVSVGNTNTFQCNPLGDEKRWWTWTDDKDKAGMCGENAPLYKGYYPHCDPDDPGFSCCSNTGFCGSGSSFCDCPTCVNYGKNPNLLIKEPVKPSRPIQWHVGYDLAKPGEPRCGKTAPKLANGQQAICNPDGNDYCCSSSGFCGSGKGFCECNGCINHRTTK